MIFISYSRQDSIYARKLTKEIIQQGYGVILDPSLVEGDAFWRNKVKENLDNTTLLLIVWSKYAAQSPWVDQEIRTFTGRKVFIQLDDTAIPANHTADEVSQHDTLNLLSKLALSTAGHVPGTVMANESIQQLRLQKLTEWTQQLHTFCTSAHTPVAIQRISENEFLSADGTIVKPLHGGLYKKGLPAVLVATTPVTNKQYKQFIEATGWPEPASWQAVNFRDDQQPVTAVTWFEAAAYACWQGGSLPTVKEWETCAGQLAKDTIYATNDNTLTTSNGLFLENFSEGNPVNASSYPCNPNGFYGMCGNTWDWCSDENEGFCAIKGGGYMDSAEFCTITAGYRNSPIDRDCCVGFRLQFAIEMP
jgi:Sulfatase-modifying factor enzyme 1/TIR domain